MDLRPRIAEQPGLDRRRLLAGSALGISSLVLPRAAVAASEASGGLGEPAALQIESVSDNGCEDSGGWFEILVILVGDITDDIRLSLSGGEVDDWLVPTDRNSGSGEVYMIYKISDPGGCQSATFATIRATPTVRVGRFVNGTLQAMTVPILVQSN